MNDGDPLALGCSLCCDFWIPGTIVRKLNGQSGISKSGACEEILLERQFRMVDVPWTFICPREEMGDVMKSKKQWLLCQKT